MREKPHWEILAHDLAKCENRIAELKDAPKGPWELIVFEHAPITRVNPTGVRFTLVNNTDMREIGPFASEPEAIVVRSVLNQLGLEDG